MTRFAYVRLNRAGTPIHIIGTHLQSNDDMCVNTDSSAIIRRTQLLEIRKFIDKLNIPLTDLIILAGDLNIERNSEEFHSLLSILQAEPPTSWSGGPFTFDPVHNSLGAANSKDSVQQNLDYILTIGSHANVVSNDLKVINAEAPPIFDLDKEYHDYSDHYPIVSTIKAIL
ncbi:hypothetical protein BGZ73_006581 [Actinomortierella ambigua]|nr:hypothetical protein BGZ73_006581 [Actinomortierella ambigua]